MDSRACGLLGALRRQHGVPNSPQRPPQPLLWFRPIVFLTTTEQTDLGIIVGDESINVCISG